MAQVAVIQRHLFLPSVLPRVLYLAIDTLSPTEADWCAERLGAFEFSSHGAADDFAAGLRAAGFEHVHAVVSEKPMAHREMRIADCGIEYPEFAKTEPRPVSTSLAVAKRAKAAEGPARDAHKPLMRKRSARKPSPTGSTASDTFSATPAAPNKFWWREGQFA